MRVYNAAAPGTPVATVTVSAGGTWTTTPFTAVGGTTYFATVTTACGTSAASLSVTALTATTARCGGITGSYTETSNLVSGTLTGTLAGTVVNLYLDGFLIGTTTTGTNAWSIPVNTTLNNILYGGGVLTIGVQEPGRMEQRCPGSVTISCNAPPAPTVTPGFVVIANPQSTATFTISNTVSGVLYAVEDANAPYIDRAVSVFSTGADFNMTTFPFTSAGVYNLRVKAMTFSGFGCESFGIMAVEVPDAGPDGIPNPVDVDDDDDGILDVEEVCGIGAVNFSCTPGGSDPSANDDGDGLLNYEDPDFCTLNAAGVCDFLDADGDGIINQFDLDSDNDGIPDIVEAGGVDTNGDGIIDNLIDQDNDGLMDKYDTDCTGGTVTGRGASAVLTTGTVTTPGNAADGSAASFAVVGNGGAITITLQNPLPVGTTVALSLSADAVGDASGVITSSASGGGFANGQPYTVNGTGSVVVNYTIVDANTLYIRITRSAGSTRVYEADYSYARCSNGTSLLPQDTDGDGIPNALDLDADNDGIADVVEAGGTDSNGDGIADDFADVDNDGLNDVVDGDVGNDGTAENSADALIVTGGDADNDGAPDTYPNGDFDRDGIPNLYDLDADNDGIADVVEAGGTDSNGDGVADNFVDTDNDGFNDVVDGDVGNDGTSENVADVLVLTGADGNGDGNPDSYDTGDFENDGNLNFLDLDADNDGIADVVEVGGTDANGDGIADNYIDVDKDGFNDVVDGDVGNDGTAENSADALVLTGNDGNGDGSPDSYTTGNADGDSTPNFLDLDSDNDGIADVVEVGGTDANGDGFADNFADVDNDGFNDVVDGDVGNDGTAENSADALVLTGTDGNGDGNPDDYPTGDVDGDNHLNFLDLDADNDGIADVVEAGGTDANGDGYADNYADVDNDGFNDVVDGDVGNDGTAENSADVLILTGNDGNGDGNPDDYPAGDVDNDNHLSFLDLDADNDGIADVVEAGGTDANGDGFADNFADVDNDGFNDVVDGDVGNDGTSENVADVLILTSTDSNGDGNPESYLSGDFDDDGILSYLDLDSDNDGIADVVEAGGTDANGDGFADNYVDTDNDGFNDVVDGDVNNDGTAENMADALVLTGADGNGDGNPDSYPGNDTDDDGHLSFLDLDSDNDGIADVVEAGGTDANGDGLVDNYVDTDNDGFNDVVDGDVNNDGTAENSADALVLTGADGNGDGNPDTYVSGDFDGDGVLNFLDLDADNDGIADVVEVNGTDANGDGFADNYADTDNDGFNDIVDGDVGNDGTAENMADVLVLTGNDGNGDGNPDTYNMGDFDGDAFLNFLDLDADNDGAQDVLEVGGVDANGDGFVDGYTDTDGDGWSQNVDGDQNNDGTIDNAAAVLVITGTDGNSDGNPDSYPDANPDNDGLYNFIDLDSDNDGITDVVENNSGIVTGAPDSDNPSGAGGMDGYVGNGTITDGNANGWHDASQGAPELVDSDGDGIPDMYDIDADNDGIADFVEGTCSTCPTFNPGTMPSGTDVNANGVLDQFENLTDANGNGGTNIGVNPNEDDNDGLDGVVDYLDWDTDNDSYYDWAEGFDNGYGGTTAGNLHSGEEIIQMAETYLANYLAAYGFAAPYYPNTDFDGDGLPIWLDNDPMNPGYNIALPPPFLDPSSPYWADEDNDGLADIFDSVNDRDGVVLGSLAPVPDNDAANDRDWRDNNTIVDFPIELLFFNAEKQGSKALLTWATATEIDNDYFDVERSIDGVEFVKIGQVKGAGTGTFTEERFYSFTDKTPLNAINYYRLRQVDTDQKVSFTDIRALDFRKDFDVAIFPNPSANVVNIQINTPVDADVTIELLDELGRNVLRQTIIAAPVVNTQIDLSDLPAAAYILRASTNNQVILLDKVVKINK